MACAEESKSFYFSTRVARKLGRIGTKNRLTFWPKAGKAKRKTVTAKIAATLPARSSDGATLPSRSVWSLPPLIFASLGSPSEEITKVVDKYRAFVASRSGSSIAAPHTRFHQKISHAICSSCADTILGQARQHSRATAALPV